MSPTSDKQLDQMLEEWADSQPARSEDLASLHRRLVDRLADGEHLTIETPTCSARSSGRRRRFLAAGLTTAAALLLAVGVNSYLTDRDDQGKLDATGQSGSALDGDGRLLPADVIWPDHIRHQARLLARCQEVFDQKIVWIAETDGRDDVGLLLSAPVAPSAQDSYVAIRLRLLSRPANENEWNLVQAFNVLASREELVEISIANGDDVRLVIWAYPIDKEMIAIDLRYQPVALAGVRIESSNVQRMGHSANIHSFEQDGVEYRLDQTAELLHDDDLG